MRSVELNPVYRLVTPAAALAVPVDAAKRQLRELGSDQDARLEELIRRATRHVEEQCGVALLGPATWRLRLDRFPCGREPLEIRRPPVSGVSAIAYTDADGAAATLDVEADVDLELDGRPARIAPVYGTTWPSVRPKPGGVSITFAAGEALAASVHPSAVQAILLIVEAWVDNPEAAAAGATPGSIAALLNDLRW